MEEYNKLEKLISKYMHECINKEIKIITPNPNNETVKLILENHKEASILDKKINKSCIVILHSQSFDKIIKMIYEYLDQNVIFLVIVQLDFEFDNLVKLTKANSIDAYYWRKDGERYKNYIVTIKRD